MIVRSSEQRKRVTPILDPAEKLRQSLLHDRRARNRDFLKSKERAAERGEQAPEIIVPHADVRRGEYTLDPYDKRKQVREVAEAIEAGRSLKPEQIVYHDEDTLLVDGSVIPAGSLEFEWNEAKLGAVAQGLACSHCWDPQPKDPQVRSEHLQRLMDKTNYRIPSGVRAEDVCCFCGTILGLTAVA